MKRSASSRSRSSSESQLGTQAGRGERTVPSGTTPEATWRANVCVAPLVPTLGEVALVSFDPVGRGVVG